MKTQPPHLVCATDFSPNAGRAADVAAALAERLGVMCDLVHVADQFHAHTEGTDDFRKAMRSARASLRQEAQRLQRGGGRFKEVLLHGHRAEIALEAILAANPPAFTVVSAVSKSAFDRWTLGSVSEHVAEHSAVPTLVVRAPDRLLAGIRGERPLKVVVGVDFTVSSDAALAWLPQLRRIAACELTAVHIHWPPDDARWVGSQPGSFPTASSRAAQRRATHSLRRKIRDVVGGDLVLRLEPNWGRADAALVHVAHEIDADLVLVGTHQRNGVARAIHPSFSRGVLRHASCNVLCVPTPLAIQHGVGGHSRIDRVLVATDLSSIGDQAIPWAYAAVAPGGVVKLVHVAKRWTVPSPLVPRYDRTRKSRGAQRRLIADVHARLAALTPRVGIPEGVNTEVEVLEDDDVAHAIGLAARHFEPSLICLSGKKRATAEALFGSVVRKVVEQNPVPILLVRPRKE